MKLASFKPHTTVLWKGTFLYSFTLSLRAKTNFRYYLPFSSANFTLGVETFHSFSKSNYLMTSV